MVIINTEKAPMTDIKVTLIVRQFMDAPMDCATIAELNDVPVTTRNGSVIYVRDVAHAFAAATTADVVGRTLLIGGDDSHRLIQGEIGASTAAAMGLVTSLVTR